mmetsp:Transcript_15601/g.42229  ORF Transcript_15601/g.42229 Transcript_15601/m.42229 type:complete len:310 (-) Transcript_15601:160-1089(-)
MGLRPDCQGGRAATARARAAALHPARQGVPRDGQPQRRDGDHCRAQLVRRPPPQAHVGAARPHEPRGPRGLPGARRGGKAAEGARSAARGDAHGVQRAGGAVPGALPDRPDVYRGRQPRLYRGGLRADGQPRQVLHALQGFLRAAHLPAQAVHRSRAHGDCALLLRPHAAARRGDLPGVARGRATHAQGRRRRRRQEGAQAVDAKGERVLPRRADAQGTVAARHALAQKLVVRLGGGPQFGVAVCQGRQGAVQQVVQLAEADGVGVGASRDGDAGWGGAHMRAPPPRSWRALEACTSGWRKGTCACTMQ